MHIKFSFLKKFMISVKTLVQHLFITMKFFSENSLANHAAAGAYGFLLSITPMILLISFFMFGVLQFSPNNVIAFVGGIPFLDSIFNEQWLTNELLTVSLSGISSVISILSIFWAGRILVLSLQRGLKVIFSGENKHNPVTTNLITLFLILLVLVLTLLALLGSQTALQFYRTFDSFNMTRLLQLVMSPIGSRLSVVLTLGIVSFFAYRLIPANRPTWHSALLGTIFFIIVYGCISIGMEILNNQTRYHSIYGTLGNLIIMLINVYFFFMIFFIGAQLTFVIEKFEPLLFINMRQARNTVVMNRSFAKAAWLLNLPGMLFFSVEGRMKKYSRFYSEGEIIFKKGDKGGEIFFILEGEVSVLFSSSQNAEKNSRVLEPGSFFGEMSHLLLEDRGATIKAKTDVLTLVLPPQIFDETLKYDLRLDRNIIENMSRRIKSGNEQIEALTSKESTDYAD